MLLNLLILHRNTHHSVCLLNKNNMFQHSTLKRFFECRNIFKLPSIPCTSMLLISIYYYHALHIYRDDGKHILPLTSEISIKVTLSWTPSHSINGRFRLALEPISRTHILTSALFFRDLVVISGLPSYVKNLFKKLSCKS